MHEIPPPATATYDGSYDGLDGRGLCVWQAARRGVESDPRHVERRREIGHGRAAAHVGTLRRVKLHWSYHKVPELAGLLVAERHARLRACRAKPFGQWQMWVALAVWPLIAWGAGSTLRVVDPGHHSTLLFYLSFIILVVPGALWGVVLVQVHVTLLRRCLRAPASVHTAVTTCAPRRIAVRSAAQCRRGIETSARRKGDLDTTHYHAFMSENE